MPDLFENLVQNSDDYSAKDIEVLEGLEPVRRRPGMYIGGSDEHAMHHLVAELLDKARRDGGCPRAEGIHDQGIRVGRLQRVRRCIRRAEEHVQPVGSEVDRSIRRYKEAAGDGSLDGRRAQGRCRSIG